jgi:hypothetical protein
MKTFFPTFWAIIAAVVVMYLAVYVGTMPVTGTSIAEKEAAHKAAAEAAQPKSPEIRRARPVTNKKADKAVAAWRKANGLSELPSTLAWRPDWEAKYGKRSYQPPNPDLQ